ncbi:hypothetical protein JRQ81_007048 [Phrynocephalus forsythii]|uniref:Uncharacterized protein n=1 Tax=Phrynocephalus forsythii TaxID=171643 RepID=A0A9Q0Y4G4_9SAUR|nr:hypothetical protein JRQ81_007048 [Phrynocephalus forsythii]
MNHIERCHRTGHNQGNLRRRDILVRFAFYTTKMDAYRALNKLHNLNYEGEKIEVYQDLPFKTRQRRKAWKDYTQILHDNDIKYKWGFPFKLIIFHGQGTRIASTTDQLEDPCKELNLQAPRPRVQQEMETFSRKQL